MRTFVCALVLSSAMSAHGYYKVSSDDSPRQIDLRAIRTSPPSVLQSRESVEVMTVTYLVQWLTEHSHDSHSDLPSATYLEENADLALRTRTELKAANVVSDDLFLREVLPYQHLDEPVDNWRPFFHDKLMPLVKNKESLKEVADTVIPFVFHGLGKQIEFKGNNTPGIMAPVSQTHAKGFASCTGLSIFVADALRSVGVPARVVGTPEWNLESGGNHNWIEVWLGDGWHFTDATPTDKVTWDEAWFTTKNTQLAVPGTIHGIYTPVWDKQDANGVYSFTWRSPAKQAPALERTAAYKMLANAKWNPEWEPYRKASEGLR